MTQLITCPVKRNDERRAVSNPLWLLLVAAVAVLLGGCGLKPVAVNQEQTPVTETTPQQAHNDPAANLNNEPVPQNPARDPSTTQNKEHKASTELQADQASQEPQTFKVRETATLAVKEFTVYSLAFSPDGKTLAGGGQFHGGGTAKEQKSHIRLWDEANLKNTKKTMTGEDPWWVSSLSFSPDGKMIFGSLPQSLDAEATLWNVTTGERINTVKSQFAINSVAFSRDGKTVAVASTPSFLWDVNTGKTTTLPAGRGPMALSPDSKTVAAASFATDGKTPEFKLWSVAESTITATLTPAMPVVGLVFSADGKTLFTAESEATGTAIRSIVEFWDVASGKKTRTISVNETLCNIRDVFTPDRKMLATISGNSTTVKLWDLASGKVVAELGHPDMLWAVAFSRDGTKVATVTGGTDYKDSTVHVWELTRGNGGTQMNSQPINQASQGQQTLRPQQTNSSPLKDFAVTGKERATLQHTDTVVSVSWSHDGKTLASASIDKTAKLWEGATGKEQATLQGHRKGLYSVSWSPDDKTLASASLDNTVKLWDVATRSERATLKGHKGEVYSVSWRPDGKTLASASWDHTVRLWDAVAGKERATLQGHSHWVWSVSWSPDGKTLASSSQDNTVKLWDAGKERASFQGQTGGVYCVSWSPDGKTLASSSWDHSVKLWDAVTGKEQATLQGHTYAVFSVSWSPDGKSLASSSYGLVKLWDTATGKELATLEGHTGEVWSVSWSPDGKTLASASSDHTVKLWDVSTQKRDVSTQK